MAKTIDTLINDIYDLLTDRADQTDDTEALIDQFGTSMADMLRSRIYAEDKDRRGLRLSGLGQCETKQYFAQLPDAEPEEFHGATLIKFLIGDICEEVILTMAEIAGHEVTGKQDTLTIEGVEGHRDAVIDGYTVDVKTASARAFMKFTTGSLKDDDPFGYMHQIASYTKADPTTKQDAGYFLAMHKEQGRLALLRIEADDFPNVKERIHKLRDAFEQPAPPPRPYEPVLANKTNDEDKQNFKLPLNCHYCAKKFQCWSDANDGDGLRAFKYSNGPQYFTKVGKEPQVEEVLV